MRAHCSWVNATHRADGIDLATNPDKVLGKSKLHYAKKRHLIKAAGAPVPSTCALFFDGKKADTLNTEEIEGVFTYRRHIGDKRDKRGERDKEI